MSSVTGFVGTLTHRLARPRLAVPLLLVSGAALRLPNLGESLWLDEVLYSTRYGLRLFGGLWRTVTRAQHGPGYPTLLYGWTAVFPETEILLRLPSLLFGLGSIVLAYFLGRQYGDNRIGLLAALLLCFSPVHVWYSQEATPYAATLFLLLAGIHVQPRIAWTRLGAAWLALYLFVITAAVMCHAYTAVYLLPLSLAALRMPRRAAFLAIGTNVFVGLMLAALLATKYLQGGLLLDAGFTRPFTPREWWMAFFNYFLHGNTLWSRGVFRAGSADHGLAPIALALQLAAAGILLYGLAAKRRDGRRPQGELAVCLVVLPVVLLVATTASNHGMYVERYLFTVLPFFAIALARGALSVRRPGLRAALVAGLLALGAGAYGALLQKHDVRTVYKPNPDWRSTARYLSAEVSHPARVAVFGSVPLNDFVYYLRRSMPEGAPEVRGYNRRRVNRALRRGVTTIYLVDNRYWRRGFTRTLESMRRHPRLQLTGRQSFKGVHLYRFDRREPRQAGVN